MATITVQVPETIQVGRGGVHGELQVDWSKVQQHMLDHIASVHFPQWFSDSFNAGGTKPLAPNVSPRRKRNWRSYMRASCGSAASRQDPIDPVDREAFTEARRILTAHFKKLGYWKNIPKKMDKSVFEYVLNKAQAALGEPETSESEYIDAFLTLTDAGKKVRAWAVKTVADRNALDLGAGLPGLVKAADVKKVKASLVSYPQG